MPTKRLINCIRRIETELSLVYDLDSTHSVVDHLIDADELQALQLAPTILESVKRAGVIVSQDQAQHLDIGVYFNHTLLAPIIRDCPLEGLVEANINAYCTIAEEVSHFHLIVSRAKCGRKVTALELEWQGEVDKLLLSSARLTEQQRSSHLIPLYLKIFSDQASFSVRNIARYQEATKYAALFWQHLIKKFGGYSSPINNRAMHDELRRAYTLPTQRKFPQIADRIVPHAA